MQKPPMSALRRCRWVSFHADVSGRGTITTCLGGYVALKLVRDAVKGLRLCWPLRGCFELRGCFDTPVKFCFKGLSVVSTFLAGRVFVGSDPEMQSIWCKYTCMQNTYIHMTYIDIHTYTYTYTYIYIRT